VTDRAPSKEFASLLAEIDRPVWKLGDGINLVARVSRDGGRQYVLGPVASEGAILPNNLFENTRKTRVKSDLVYFAEAYRAMRMGEFETARTTLQEASTLYDLSQTTLGYMLPYYAFAAAKSGDVSVVEKMLDNFKIEHQRFDYYLARGVIAGIGGKTDESLQFLKIALHRRPYTENRPLFTEYEYAEICEWLYDATHNPKYRERALDWAKKNQKFQPWFSWPYAMEAKLSTNERQRHQAIAMTFYLDRNSDRLSKIPKREVDAAVREFAKNNPFLKKKASLKQRSI
jgi:hypothetical protein